jgi:CheY-like chemotaxis protein
MRTSETVRSEEIRVLFEQSRTTLWANLTLGAVVVGALWNDAPRERLLVWLGASLGLTLARAWLHRRYRTAQPSAPELAIWGRRLVLGSTLSGLLWGAASVVFFSTESPLSQGLLAFAIAGVTAGAAGSLACHLPAFFGFFWLSLTPLVLRACAEGDRLHLYMAGMLVLYGALMQRVARHNHRSFTRAFRLASENALLLKQLSTSQVDLEETNRNLEQRVLERTRALEQQAGALRQAQRLEVAGRLAGGLAHDFNSLLTVITNNAAQLRESPGLDEQGRLAAMETLQAGQRGVALIRHLLAFSRHKRAEPKIFSLNTLLEEWAPLLEHVLGEGCRITLELAREPTHVFADPAQVEQVLVNLLASSRAALAGSGPLLLGTRVVHVDHDAERESGDYVELLLQHRVLESSGAAPPLNPFFSLEAESSNLSLGVAAARATAEQWGGRLETDDRRRDVQRYEVLLPAAASRASARPRERPQSQPAPGDATILVVDDEPTLRSVIRRCLMREGYSVLVAEDGKHALHLADNHPGSIHLLLTDVVMPGLSGLELAQKLQRTRPGLAVLFISGYTFDEAVPPADPARVMAYLPKPFDTKTLIAKVHELLFVSRAEKKATRDSA